MRLRHPDGSTVHLAYCTNVHPAENLDGVLGQLSDYAEPVREQLGAQVLGLGLWLAHDVAAQLSADPAAVSSLRKELDARGLEVVTLNGFPYRGFQEPVVKHKVYSPDWSARERLDYTLSLARILAALLPDDAARGSVSTLPYAWRTPWPADAVDAAQRQLDRLARGLASLEADTGRTIRVGLEPEPGCVVETTAQAAEHLRDVDTDRIGVCLDACHLAVGFEDAGEALARLDAVGLSVVKAQASAALQADDPADEATRAALRRFDEPRFLHQTRRCSAGVVSGRDDLGAALDEDAGLAGGSPWRVHFHVPLHSPPEAPLASTAETSLDATLRALVGGAHPRTDHIEVETYTWGVLPDGQRPTDRTGLVGGIAAEVAWARKRLVALGLEGES